jgi:8-oxo-dGTP pyrophosphatase MutT (NUDIX family)
LALDMNIATVRDRLRTHRPAVVPGTAHERAAVALILRDAAEGAEFIAIRRTERVDDPWSGHIALPGGREHPSDSDLFMTAARETREEIGIDLETRGQLLGQLDQMRPMGGGSPLDLVVSPFVYAVNEPVTLVLNRREVHSAFWVPVPFLHRDDARGSFRLPIQGFELEHPAFIYQGHTIWGLTYRILNCFLDVLRTPPH